MAYCCPRTRHFRGTQMSESDEMFREIQDEGMADIGTKVEFEMDGGKYYGTINSPEASTQMLTGGYQGRSVMVILATKRQFPTIPSQRGDITITASQDFDASQWTRKQVEVYGAAHYAITVQKQLPTE
jgi:hypothetical protein